MHDLRGEAYQRRLARRYAAERRFKALGLGAVIVSVAMLLILLVTILSTGLRGFQRVELAVPINFAADDIAGDAQTLAGASGLASLEAQGLPELVSRSVEEAHGPLQPSPVPADAWREVARHIAADPGLLQRQQTLWLPASAPLVAALEGRGDPELQRQAQALQAQGVLARRFDGGFFARSDATQPQDVGIWGALKGSLLTMIVTLSLAFPIGVLAALYLEEYAPRNRWTDAIEISINNLAAVPSIIFGLLGLAVFLTIFPNYRSAPLIAGLTLALMTMPVIVITGRNAIKAVPPSIRDGALALGASPVQVVFHHVLPLALPGILTGTIIGMARALGETAPLLMIGMRAFVATPPDGFTSPATVLPVQIFLWSDEVSRGFVERTSAAIIVLLLFLLTMNALAIYLRNRFERRW
ncbi:phosphate ABC transporter permease PstA [Erythrobacteraceae bacterium CFH 75059]|nr:phosphate ABC transporter permease PstA [Qipengyuania thermophila]TCD05528.1 phosphate ABC transporter permease PstA [Erythrobacteraceae bacterium CFH 75059]